MTHIIGLEFGAREDFSIACKRVMEASIERAMEADPGLSKKAIALEMGYTQTDLAHWLSPRCPRSTIPAHLVPLFCQIVGDNSLLWLLQEAYEQPTKNNATARPVA